MSVRWQNTTSLSSRQYTCGHCGSFVGSATGFFAKLPSGHATDERIYICPFCTEPTYFGGAKQVPGVRPGADVKHVPTDISALYNEARDCAAAGAHTSSVLTCRKILMNLAVANGAPEGESFLSYVSYLVDHGFVPPNGKGWVDHIRTRGNEATHEIHLMNAESSAELISFVEMLLTFIYEFPARIAPTGI